LSQAPGFCDDTGSVSDAPRCLFVTRDPLGVCDKVFYRLAAFNDIIGDPIPGAWHFQRTDFHSCHHVSVFLRKKQIPVAFEFGSALTLMPAAAGLGQLETFLGLLP
jgi:hypothetical protein